MTTEHESPLDFQPSEMPEGPPPRKPGVGPAGEGKVLLGFALGLGMNVLVGLIAWAAEAEMVLLIIGLIQLAYLVPTWIVLRVKGLKRTALGVLILAAVVFLLNSACWGIGLFLFSGLH